MAESAVDPGEGSNEQSSTSSQTVGTIPLSYWPTKRIVDAAPPAKGAAAPWRSSPPRAPSTLLHRRRHSYSF